MTAPRGLLDFVLTLMTCAAVYTQTPVGGLIDRALAWGLGLEGPKRRLTDFFDFAREGVGAPSQGEIDRIAALRIEPAGELSQRARKRGLSVALVRALELALDDSVDGTVAAAEQIEGYAERLGHLDAGIEAFVLGLEPVERAVTRASRDGAKDPATHSGHARYLTRLQREESAPLVNQVMAIFTALTFEWPVAEPHRVSSPFGYRGDPFLGTRRFHNGIDLAIPVGTRIRAAGDGRVKYATYDGVNGYFVKLNHGYGLSTAYCHNSRLLVRAGETTERGGTIALSGSTGRSTGPHLHYIVRIGSKAIDPAQFRPIRDTRRSLK